MAALKSPHDAVEVEEADLSSDDDRASPVNPPIENDFVLNDHDDVDDDDDDLHPTSPSPLQNHSPSTNSSPKPSPSSSNQSPDHPSDDDDSSSEKEPGDSSEYHQEDGDEEEDDDDDNDDADAEDDDDALDDRHLNGDSHLNDDSDTPSNIVRRKKTRASSSRVVIPDELRGNTEFFRRSRRERSRPDRLSISPNGSPSEEVHASDSDFNAEEEVEEEYEEEFEDDDDEDYGTRIRKRRTTSSRPKSSRSKRQHAFPKLSDADEPILDDPPADSESDSDGDWLDDGPRKRKRSRRSVLNASKRRRTALSAEDEEAARTARINSRTNTSVNYFEGDDEPFDSADEAAMKAQQEEEEVDDKTPRIEAVLQYRLIEGRTPRYDNDLPFADFYQNDVEFRIQWANKSIRSATWEIWDFLKHQKGAKRVSNWITGVNKSREYCQKQASPEEIEEMRIYIAELLQSTKRKEIAERVVAQRETEEDGQSFTEFLVKWIDVSYDGCTWEKRSDLSSEADQKLVDEFTDREQAALSMSGKKLFNPFNMKDDRPKFKRMNEQPSFLHGDGRTLRDYQLAGLNFLAFSWTKRNNVILADEMGLGKTVQTISFIGWLKYTRNVQRPFLVVVPLSTIAAWVREFVRWLPDMNVICYTGNAKARATIREHEFFSETKKSIEKFDVLLTTPELLMMDQAYLDQFRFSILAVDEAHRLKNETSALHTTLANLRSANRLLVTGTPLQNSVRELWALLHFLNPGLFPNAEEFEKTFSFSALRDPERVTNLHDTLRPFIIRRQKSDVEKSLPKKTYNVLRVAMTAAQQQYYRWLLTKNVAKLNAASKARGMGNVASIRNLLMELKKCCNHLFLFEDYEDTSTPTSVNDLINASGKMILLDKLLIRLREKGHRVLIFSQMVRMLDILQDYCRMRNFPFQRLDGTCSNEARQRAVDHYNAPESIDFIFLLSTRAGGLGINLATADTVIIFDSDWNPQNDLQAESRAHRIGQKKDVKVFRLLSRETVEEDILERAKRKRVLEHVVIHGVEGGNKTDGAGENAFKKEELSAILRFGAEKLFAKDNLEASNAKASENGTSAAPSDSGDKVKEQTEEKPEDRRVLDADDIDELLNRETDEPSQVGSEQPSIGASLLNAFKWNDFSFEEEAEEPSSGNEKDKENKKMAKAASTRMIEMEKEVSKAKQREEEEQKRFATEGDSQFWDRVIPEHIRESAIAEDTVLGTRRRKRPKTFGADSPRAEKRRRGTRGSAVISGKVADQYELTEKERRSLFRSFRKFGDPELAERIVKDSGLLERIDAELAKSIFEECIEFAKSAIQEANQAKARKSKDGDDYDDDPPYDRSYEAKSNGKESKGKAARIFIDILGEKKVDAVELLKRCRDLKLIREQVSAFESDIQFRLRRVIKAPSYTIRWKPQNDAMLLVGISRHGLGNWTLIARDEQLHLGDKMQVAGNPNYKEGAPDTVKLQRRITTLIRELEKDKEEKARVSSKRNEKSAKGSKKRGRKGASTKVDKKISKKTKGRKPGRPKKKGRDYVSNNEDEITQIRLRLKKSHLKTLRELRSLSTQNNQLESSEKIKRTKQCLIRLGDAIESQAAESSSGPSSSTKDPAEIVRKALWGYVHDVCRTSLDGDRLQTIYGKLSAAQRTRNDADS